MMPSMVGQLMSYADVQYRQDELARQFAETRGASSRRARRRAARAAQRAEAAATTSTSPASAPARPAATPVLPRQTAADSSSIVLDDRLPVC
jgi:hypothetical protein